MTTTPVLAILDHSAPTSPRARVVDLATPVLRADDLGATRGDGAFETMHVRGSSAWLINEHLARLARSTARLTIDLPPREHLVELIHTAIAAWPADGGEAGIKLVCSRGAEFAPVEERTPTIYALVFPLPDSYTRARRDGVRVHSFTLGVPAELRANAPWLLGGVKSLSYGMNMALLRESARRGGDEALLTTEEGIALEGPTSSVFWLDGDTLATTPDELGILPGTTVQALFSVAGELGLTTERRTIRASELGERDGAWLCSSVRGVVPIAELDGAPLKVSPLTRSFVERLGFPTPD